MSKLVIRVDTLAGTNVRAAISEMLHLARKWDCNLETSFNGVSIFVTKNSDVKELSDRYREALKKGRGFA